MQMVEELKSPGFMERLSPWIICISSTLFFFYEFIQGNMFASIADNVMHDFHIQADKMAYLSSIYYFSNVIFLFVAGLLLDKYSAKRTLLVAMALCVGSTYVLSFTESYAVALLCRFITGIGSAFCFLGPVRIASYWFPPKRMAMVTGVIVTMAMTGGMLAQYPLASLVMHLGWREALVHVSELGLIMLAIMCFGVKDKASPFSHHAERSNSWVTLKKAYFNIKTLYAAAYTSLMNIAIAVFGAMIGSLYLMQRLDITKEEAALVNSMLFLGSIIGGPLIGWLSDKLSLRLLPMKIAAIASLITVLAILYAPLSLTSMSILFFLLGFFTSAQIISYALVAENNSPVMTATALSVISVLTQGGYILYQNAFSWMLQHHGGMQVVDGVPVYSLADYQYAAILLPIGLVVALFCLRGLKKATG